MRGLVSALAALVMAATQAHSAILEESGPVQTDPGIGCSLTLSGEIGRGDADALSARLDALIAGIDNYPSGRPEQQIVLCLQSPGGSFVEAVAMARAIHQRDVTTRVSPGESCLSACAVAFLGGRFNSRSGEGSWPSRYLHPDARLGFHAPALILPEGDFTREDAQRAYDIAIEAVGLISLEARTLGLPQDLLTAMFTHHGEDFFYVTTLDHAAYFDIRLYGYDLPAIRRETTRHACMNAWHWHVGFNVVGETLTDYNNFAVTFADAGNGIQRFSPFDGDMYCRHLTIQTGGGERDNVILSEWPGMENPRVDGVYPGWVRIPGPALLSNLPRGSRRDP